MRKKIVLTVHQAPRAWGPLREVLHTAVGLACGSDEHQVEVILVGEGVVHGLRDHAGARTEKYLRSARAHGVELFADQGGMTLRGLGEAHLLEGIGVLPRERIVWKLGQAEVHVRI